MDDQLEDGDPFILGKDCYFCGSDKPIRDKRLLKDGRRELQCAHCYIAMENGAAYTTS